MAEDLPIRPGLTIPAEELEESHSRSGGPGDQHVNTSSTKITLRWRLGTSNLVQHLKDRLLERLGSRLTKEGDLVIQADEHRSQLMNREAARDRMAATVRAGLVVPKVRRATAPSKGQKRARLDDKKKRGETKKLRGAVDD